MTAFAAGGGTDEPAPLDAPGVPVFQVVSAITKRAAWRDSARGLGAADLAMHVVLPELDGRVLAGAIAFKDALPPQAGLAFSAFASRPEPDRVAMVADRIAAHVVLQALPASERRVAILMPDYPGAPGRTGYAVGLDVPASVIALLDDLSAAGYAVRGAPKTPRELLDALSPGGDDATLAIEEYQRLLARLPSAAVARLRAAWGEPADDTDVRDGAFRFRVKKFGKLLVALPPDRGRSSQRRADYHDPLLPPRHALVAFGLWLQHVAKVDALVHMGAHGTLEWLPGKAIALTAECFPEIVTGALPVIYPFIVSNPGEAAQAKRRIAALTIGHLPPPLVDGGLSGDARELERLVDEYAQADGLDRRRRERLATLIVETAQRTGLAREAGVGTAFAPDEALRRIDAWLCDLKDLAIKDGLHIYGRAPAGIDDPLWRTSAEAERKALIAALDGRRVAPGPAGSPTRGRRDVLPTGRNLFTADPRTLPTPTAMELGRLAADEIVRAHLQTHGEMVRAVVIDLWGSATLRTGGEEIAQGFSLMGCRPIWEPASGRITGVEVLPPAAIGRPRVDVTWRISGLFRDLFPAQIALIDAAVQAVAARDEDNDENPLAAARRGGQARLDRIFGTAPGVYGSGVEDLLGRDAWTPTLSVRLISPPRHTPMAAPMAKATRRPAHLRSASPAPKRSCMRATTPAATSSKATRTQPSSAASPRRRRCSAAQPISSCSTSPIRSGRARGRCRRRWRGSCGRARSIRASSPARCATVRAAPPSLPKPSTAWSRSPKPPTRWPANCSISCTTPMSPMPMCANFCCARTRKPPQRLPSDSMRRGGAASGIHGVMMSKLVCPCCVRRSRHDRTRTRSSAATRRLSWTVRADGDRRRSIGSPAADRHHCARCLRHTVRDRAAARQWHHRGHVARQHPSSRIERGVGAAFRSSRRRPRHRGRGRHPGSERSTGRPRCRTKSSTPARSPPICALLSRRAHSRQDSPPKSR